MEKNIKGITLISLVITIVIMLILAGVSISLIIGKNGIFTQSKKSVEISKQKQTEEKVNLMFGEYNMMQAENNKDFDEFLDEKISDDIINEFNNNNDGTYTIKIDGYDVIIKKEDLSIININKSEEIDIMTKIHIGDYINYNPDGNNSYSVTSNLSGYTSDQIINKDASLKWKILNINENGSIDIISETPTNDTLYFGGAKGYDNGVYLMNDICEKLYSHGSIKARSINLDDIEKQMTDEAKAQRVISTNTINVDGTYIESKTESTITYKKISGFYPNLYSQENNSGIDTTDTLTNGIDKSDKKAH